MAAVVLAAGGASRMGLLKQLLPVGGRSLLRGAAEAAARSRCGHVRVVLGADADLLKDELRGLDVEVAVNRAWRTGIASSLRSGLRGLPGWVDAVLVLLADQPLVTAAVLDRVLDARRRGGTPVVACEYAGTLGAPALFGRALFPELEALRGDTGAKPVLLRHARQVSRVPFPGGEVDLDRPEDYRELSEGRHASGPGPEVPAG